MSQAEVPKVSEHFAKYTPETQGEAWDALWKRQTTPWDRGAHNPALEDALIQRTSALGSPIQESDADSDGKGRRKKALVPGCGRGFDVFLLAEFGYDAYGLEYSPTAVNAAREQAIKIGDEIPVRYPELGKGSVTFVQGDFFKDEWIASAGLEKATTFDLIYDYTFFCALNPVLRPAWALRMSQLLSPSPIGNLICLEFPTFKDPAAGGPPFASPPTAYMEHLSHPGEEVAYDESGKVKMDPLRKSSSRGLERVIHWQPERTHDVGKDDNGNILDWVSIWRRRN